MPNDRIAYLYCIKITANGQGHCYLAFYWTMAIRLETSVASLAHHLLSETSLISPLVESFTPICWWCRICLVRWDATTITWPPPPAAAPRGHSKIVSQDPSKLRSWLHTLGATRHRGGSRPRPAPPRHAVVTDYIKGTLTPFSWLIPAFRDI